MVVDSRRADAYSDAKVGSEVDDSDCSCEGSVEVSSSATEPSKRISVDLSSAAALWEMTSAGSTAEGFGDAAAQAATSIRAGSGLLRILKLIRLFPRIFSKTRSFKQACHRFSENDIHFNIPLYWTYSAALEPEAGTAAARTFVRWSGVESLTVTQPDPNVTYLIEMQATQYCRLKDVEAERADWRLVWMLQSLQNEIRESYFHESINGYGRSHGYGMLVDMFSSANLVENNIFKTLDGGMMMTAGGAAGNVFGYNYMEDSRFDDEWWATASPALNHAPHPMMNLWEGNVGYQISGDFIHGSSSHNTVYRSVSRGWQRESVTSNNNAVELATKNTSMNSWAACSAPKGAPTATRCCRASHTTTPRSSSGRSASCTG